MHGDVQVPRESGSHERRQGAEEHKGSSAIVQVGLSISLSEKGYIPSASQSLGLRNTSYSSASGDPGSGCQS